MWRVAQVSGQWVPKHRTGYWKGPTTICCKPVRRYHQLMAGSGTKMLSRGSRVVLCKFRRVFHSNYVYVVPFPRYYVSIRIMVCPWKLGWRLFAAVQNGAIRQIAYEFVFHCNYITIIMWTFIVRLLHVVATGAVQKSRKWYRTLKSRLKVFKSFLKKISPVRGLTVDF